MENTKNNKKENSCKCETLGNNIFCSECLNRIQNSYKLLLEHAPDSQMGIYATSEVCKPSRALWSESEALVRWLNASNGSFEGNSKVAYAISHCQVAEKPLRLFVVHNEFINEMGLDDTKARNKKNFYFPAQAIFNAKVIEAPEKLERIVSKRVADGKTGYKIIKEKGLVDNLISVPDACMSFPHKKPKNVQIYHTIKVTYQTKGRFGLFKTHTEWVEGLKSHIFQHEIDHSNAINIYYKNK